MICDSTTQLNSKESSRQKQLLLLKEKFVTDSK